MGTEKKPSKQDQKAHVSNAPYYTRQSGVTTINKAIRAAARARKAQSAGAKARFLARYLKHEARYTANLAAHPDRLRIKQEREASRA